MIYAVIAKKMDSYIYIGRWWGAGILHVSCSDDGLPCKDIVAILDMCYICLERLVIERLEQG